MNKNTAIVQLAVPVGLTDQELFEAIRGALARGLPHDAKLKDVVLQDAFVLDQGESVEIVPADEPAAEEEIETILVKGIQPHPRGFVVAVEGGYLGACGRYTATCIEEGITSSGVAVFPNWTDACTAVERCYALVWTKE